MGARLFLWDIFHKFLIFVRERMLPKTWPPPYVNPAYYGQTYDQIPPGPFAQPPPLPQEPPKKDLWIPAGIAELPKDPSPPEPPKRIKISSALPELSKDLTSLVDQFLENKDVGILIQSFEEKWKIFFKGEEMDWDLNGKDPKLERAQVERRITREVYKVMVEKMDDLVHERRDTKLSAFYYPKKLSWEEYQGDPKLIKEDELREKLESLRKEQELVERELGNIHKI